MEWLLEKVNKFGWNMVYAKAEWARIQMSPGIESDNNGHKGALRLWLMRDEARHRDNER
jgi:hypothetical protein